MKLAQTFAIQWGPQSLIHSYPKNSGGFWSYPLFHLLYPQGGLRYSLWNAFAAFSSGPRDLSGGTYEQRRRNGAMELQTPSRSSFLFVELLQTIATDGVWY